jgi:probable HAF family extracellular repeat protein
MLDLGTLGGNYSFAFAINASGQITGGSSTSSGSSHAFLYTGSPGSAAVMADLGTLGGTNSAPSAINARGQIVGWADLPNGTERPFLYVGTPGIDGHMIDLDTWLDDSNPIEGAKWTLSYVNGINDSGLITGQGIYNEGPDGLSDGRRAFLLDASSLVPEPCSLLISLCLTALTLRPRRRS